MVNFSNFNSLLELITTFTTEEKCIEYLENIRWNGKVVSPFDPNSKVYKCSNGYWCKNTNRLFNVKTRTIFENTKVPLQKWFVAIWLITSHKKGISSLQLAKDIRVTQKTGWFMLQRIRKCFESENDGRLFNKVEIDETYIGGYAKCSKDSKDKGTQGRSTKSKTPIIGIVERKGKLISHIINDAKSSTLTPAVVNKVDFSATVFTDEWRGYVGVDRLYNHMCVRHNDDEYVNGIIYTNTIENFWGLLKRGLLGIYHRPSKKHLQKYIDEYVFRYNTRKLNECKRFDILLMNMANRLRYRELVDSLN